MITVTPVYAALLTVLYLVLTARVITMRRAGRVSMGDGGDKVLLRRMRAHGNFAEYAPLGIVLMLGAELAGAGTLGLHVTGLMLLVGRMMHGIVFSFLGPNMMLRTGGMVLTLLALALGALLGLVAVL